jgi:serine-type anaerobic sulfatase-maturating enzyme
MLRSVIVKVASVCNIECEYCYVARSRDWSTSTSIMRYETLERIVESVGIYCANQDAPGQFVFYWHGGEPLLAGHDFFDRVIALQTIYMPPHVTCVNSLQTNGILLNPTWIKQLKQLNYCVCISLDGPQHIHDLRRLTKRGTGTYAQVVTAIQAMRDAQCRVALMAVIIPEALSHGYEIYSHFRELGCTWMDLMYPMCNSIQSTLGHEIRPQMWGRFYCDVFDAWVEEDDPSIYVRQLHDWCMLLLGGKTDMCTSQSDCSYVLTISTDGNVYVCDDVLPYYGSLLGNINVDTLDDLAGSETVRALADPSFLYGSDCRSCHYFPACKGGCTLFRAKARNDFSAKHYFCESQRAIIDHIRAYFCQQIKRARRHDDRQIERIAVEAA